MKPTAGTIWDAGLRGVRARNRFEPIPLWADIEMKPTDGSIWDAGLRAWNERCEAQGLKLEACDTDMIARGAQLEAMVGCGQTRGCFARLSLAELDPPVDFWWTRDCCDYFHAIYHDPPGQSGSS